MGCHYKCAVEGDTGTPIPPTTHALLPTQHELNKLALLWVFPVVLPLHGLKDTQPFETQGKVLVVSL